MITGYDSIIFDLDGTLWDPTQTCLRCWNAGIARLDLKLEPLTEEALWRVFGMKVDLIPDVLFPTLSKDEKELVLNECIRYENEYIRQFGGGLYECLEPILSILSKTHQLFIVSNCQAGYIESFLAYYQLTDYFKDIECPGNTGLDKAQNIKLIIERNGLKSPVYVGDTLGDYHSAKANQLPFFFASYGFGVVTSPDVVLTKLSDLVNG